MNNNDALNVLTDWFHSYVDDNGIRVHCRHIDDNYIQAKEMLKRLIDEYDEQIQYKTLSTLEHKKNKQLEKELEESKKVIDYLCKQLGANVYCWDESENGCDCDCKECWKRHAIMEVMVEESIKESDKEIFTAIGKEYE